MAYNHLDEKEINLDEQTRRYNEEMSYYETDTFGERLGKLEDEELQLEAEEDELENQLLADSRARSIDADDDNAAPMAKAG